MEKVPESLGYNGEVIVANTHNAGAGRRRGGGRMTPRELPAHPMIDSGFIVTRSAVPKFKMGIEMQVANEGNMAARISDYGARIFKYKKTDPNVGYLKTYELALVRWEVQNFTNTILSTWGVPAVVCDATVPVNFINGTPLCCAHIFLGTVVKAMDVVLNAMQNNYQNNNWTIDDDDKTAARTAVSNAKDDERTTLINQMRVLFNKGGTAFNNWTVEEKKLVNRIGFFKYGHLMSQTDVDGLNDNNLQNDYECMKIKEENIMNNISDIEAIYGKVYSHDLRVLQENATLINELAAKDREIKRLRQQLKARNKNTAPDSYEKIKKQDLHKRNVKIKKLKHKGRGSDSSSQSTSESSNSDSSPTSDKGKRGKSRSRGK
jgi:hypothetical protein